MNNVKLTFAIAMTALSLSVNAQNKLEANKKIVADYIQKVWHEKDSMAVKKYIAKDYVQHNPMSYDYPQGIIAMLPYVSPKITTVRSIAEGDLVLQHNDSKGWGDTTHYASFDIFRIINGQIVEHWDVMQPFAYKSASGHTMVDGESNITDKKKTAANKKIVQAFMADVIFGAHYENAAKYISDKKYIQHNPMAKDGLEGMREAMLYMAKQGMTLKFEKTYRIIAEGNFVFAHSKGEFLGKKVIFADLFRLENGKIVEHWDLIQDEVPADKAKNGHDMYSQISK